MDLAQQYTRQLPWRPWPRILAALPPLDGQAVLDLGCGVGDQAAALASRGARVVGVDRDEDLLARARARGIPGAEFVLADLRALTFPAGSFDGLWCGFAAAYFPDLAPVLASWLRLLRPGGWVALTEVDDLFGHRPLRAGTVQLLEAYARESRPPDIQGRRSAQARDPRRAAPLAVITST